VKPRHLGVKEQKMGQFLTQEQMGQVGDLLQAEGPPSEPTEPEAVESAEEEEESQETPETPEDTSESVSADANEASSETEEVAQSTAEATEGEETAGSGKHRVPYSRFQEVVHARNKYQSEVDDLRKQQEALQKELERLNSVSNRKAKQRKEPQYDDEYDDDELDSEFIENGLAEDEPPAPAGWEKHYKSLEDRVQRFELEQAKAKLESVLGEVGQQYPSVPRQAILQHIIDKPPRPSHIREKVFELAERYTSYIAQVEEAAIARHLEAGGGEAKKKAAPRPSKSGGSGPAKSISAGDKKPKTLKDASKALWKFMEETNPFG
jgi:hypothetical protein